MYVDKIRLGKIRATFNVGNAWGFGTEFVVGNKGSVKLQDGQTIWMRVDRRLKTESVPPRWGSPPDDQHPDRRTVEVTLEFNPSRFLYPNPHDGSLPTTLLIPLLRKMPKSVFQGLGLSNMSLLHPEVRLVRIDLARDFTIGDVPPPKIFEKIRRTPWRYRPTLKVYNKAGEPDNTLEVERDAFNIKLYDQKVLQGYDFPTDLRCEMNVKRAKYPGGWDIRSPESWTPDVLTNVLRECFLRRVPFGAQTSAGRLDLGKGRLCPS